MTGLMLAAQEGHTSVADLLLRAQASVNATEEDDWAALHFAAKDGHIEVCQLLMLGRADAQMFNCDGISPLSLCQAKGDNDFSTRLENLIRLSHTRPPPCPSHDLSCSEM